MKRYTEDYIYKYLDQELSAEQQTEFEQVLKNDQELQELVAEARSAHELLSQNALEKAPEELSNQVMARIKTSTGSSYYRPSGMFSNTGFLLTSGILTALVAVLSMINTGYLDLQRITPWLVEGNVFTDSVLWQSLFSKKIITNAMLVIYGLLALILLDRFVFHPFFHSKVKQLGLH